MGMSEVIQGDNIVKGKRFEGDYKEGIVKREENQRYRS